MAGHGGTQGLPLSGGHLGDYAALMGRVIEELGIRQAVLAGHSMGGRVTAQLAAQRPEQTIAVLLIDAIVGDQWDLMVNLFRLQPFLLAPLGRGAGARLGVHPAGGARPAPGGQARASCCRPVMVNHATHPWRLIGPAASILRTAGQPRHPRRAGPRRGADLRAARRPRPDRAHRHGPLGGQAGQRPAHHRQGRGPLVDAARSRDPAGHRGRAARGPAGRGHPRGDRGGRAPTRPTSSRPSSTSPTRPSSSSRPPTGDRSDRAHRGTAHPATAGPSPERVLTPVSASWARR